jgi:hypothetical protein
MKKFEILKKEFLQLNHFVLVDRELNFVNSEMN